MMKNKIIASVLLLSMLSPIAMAAAPTPQTDEAVYVNLDGYGTQKEMRIVKGVTLNGANKISDFGNYSEVNNLTSHDEPIKRSDGVDFDLKDTDNERFYFECIPENPDTLQMPWTFDLSYKLNGEQIEYEDLAGVSGLVEITIHAIPNPNADEYYRNNMTLIAGTGINMDKASNIEAEGAQIQSFGSYKFAVFIGLPSEENTYTIKIGAEDFEFTGMYFLMTPATLSQLDMVNELKKAKDNLSDAGGDLYTGLSSMLSTMNSMKSGLNTMQAGISGIDTVRKELISSRATLDPSLDAALNQIDLLAGDTNALIPTLETANNDLNQIHQNSTDILNTVVSTQEDIASYQALLSDVKNNLTDIKNLLSDLSNETDKNQLSLKYISSDLSDLEMDSDRLASAINSLQKSIENLHDAEAALNNIIQQSLPPELQSAVSQIINIISPIKSSTETLLKELSNTSNDLSHLFGNSASLTKQLNDINNVLNDYRGTAENSVELAIKANDLIENSLSTVDTMLNELATLNESLQTVNTNANSAITQITTSTTTLSNTILAANKALTDTRDTIRSLRESSDAATQKSLDGLLDVIGKATNSNDTANLQNATDSIHNTITNEVNSIENDSNLLNIDNSLAMRSFTSSSNPSPASLQFIVRTDEITVDEIKEVQEKIANEKDEGVFSRIANIFKKIFDAVKSAF